MNFNKCPKCGNQFTLDTTQCPKCGTPIERSAGNLPAILAAIMITMAVMYYFFLN